MKEERGKENKTMDEWRWMDGYERVDYRIGYIVPFATFDRGEMNVG